MKKKIKSCQDKIRVLRSDETSITKSNQLERKTEQNQKTMHVATHDKNPRFGAAALRHAATSFLR